MEEVMSFLTHHEDQVEINPQLFINARDPELVYLIASSFGTLYTINGRHVMVKRSNQEKQPNRLVLSPGMQIQRCLGENVPVIKLTLAPEASIIPRYCHRPIFSLSTIHCNYLFLFGTFKLVIGSLVEEMAADHDNRAYWPSVLELEDNEELILKSSSFDIRIGSSEHRIYMSQQQLADDIIFKSPMRTLQQLILDIDT